MSNIVLIGMPGCGKSTCGVLTAKALCMDFADTDLIIQAQEGRKLQEIIDTDGNVYFEKAEERALLESQFDNTVIATGGSADDFANTVMDICENYPRHALDHSLTLLDSHDTVRILNELAQVNTNGWTKQMLRDYRLTPQQRRLGGESGNRRSRTVSESLL